MPVMNRTPEQQGDLSRLRDIKDRLQKVLSITGDMGALNTCVPGDVDAIQDNILRAYVAVGNAMSRLGDHSLVSHADFEVPHQRRRP